MSADEVRKAIAMNDEPSIIDRMSQDTGVLIVKNWKATVWLVILFLVGFLTIRSCEAQAGTIEGGGAIASSELSGAVIAYNERLAGKWDIGIFVVSDQTFKKPEGNIHMGVNAAIHGQRIVNWKSFEMGLGAAYWQNTNRLLGCHLTFSLSVRQYFANKRFAVSARHFSNAGSCAPNSGQDMILFGWRF